MLRMSKLTDYGTLVMVHLAREPARVHAATEIAQSVRIAVPTVTKVLKILARDGLLQSHRGTKGGYVLAIDPADVSLARVLEAMEGPLGLTECGSAPGRCQQESTCSTRGNWQFINNVVMDALRNVSLAQMAAPQAQPVRMETRRRSATAGAGRTRTAADETKTETA